MVQIFKGAVIRCHYDCAPSENTLPLQAMCRNLDAQGVGFRGCHMLLATFVYIVCLPQVLNILEFNSTRKRMSVVVRDDRGKIIIFTKVCVWGCLVGAVSRNLCSHADLITPHTVWESWEVQRQPV
jgi:hypothetical protein